jgi:hypothetical protein
VAAEFSDVPLQTLLQCSPFRLVRLLWCVRLLVCLQLSVKLEGGALVPCVTLSEENTRGNVTSSTADSIIIQVQVVVPPPNLDVPRQEQVVFAVEVRRDDCTFSSFRVRFINGALVDERVEIQESC